MGMLEPVVTEAWRTKPCTGLLSGDDLSIPGGVKPAQDKGFAELRAQIQLMKVTAVEMMKKGGKEKLWFVIYLLVLFILFIFIYVKKSMFNLIVF